ncbi:MAG: 2-oxoglutarate dehydrogenase complex dihydrolipoyllysine-residue succinyltransferase [Gammaproteobacteria bacterium]|nr:2-oxoglutarate dehydrogenase complex dihydrolipoyllysine-residue succinyltransferase [Gammaproteobacteria bacterium]
MTIEVRVPTLPESVADAVVLSWHKQPGEAVQRDEVLVDIETDKVVLEVPAPVDGVLQEIVEADGQTVTADQVLAIIGDGAGKTAAAPAPAAAAMPSAAGKSNGGDGAAGMGPAARKLIAEHGLDVSQISGSGKGGRITKEDVVQHMENAAAQAPAAPAAPAAAPAPASAPAPSAPMAGAVTLDDEQRPQKRVPMTRLRARIAERLLHASQSTAMLTTFNEVNMKPLMDLRTQYKDQFEKAHGVRFGFMSMFVKACAEALQRFPEINASIDGNDVVYHGFVDVGVAVSSDRGLVVPVLRDAEHMTLAQIETTIRDLGSRARDGKLNIEEMTGGTFTITNGGVFGSLLSTPILNPPQSAILGMHAIQERPVVESGEIVVRPMMYVALSYDHRVVDGQGAVTFLRTIKELVEDPHRILLDV